MGYETSVSENIPEPTQAVAWNQSSGHDWVRLTGWFCGRRGGRGIAGCC